MSRVFNIINIAYERLLIRKRKQLSKKILSLCYSLYKSCFRKYITDERMLLLCSSADVLQSRSLSRSILTELCQDKYFVDSDCSIHHGENLLSGLHVQGTNVAPSKDETSVVTEHTSVRITTLFRESSQ